MATIKSYTDLEQSKKLAEILPLESTDCFWDYDEMQKFHRISWFEDGYNKESQLIFNENNVCAWSLSALLELIPNWTMDKTDKVNLTCNPYYHCESCYEDPIDAVFEMVCWLKENGKI